MSGKYSVIPSLRQTKALLINVVIIIMSLSGYENFVGVVLILHNLPASMSCNSKMQNIIPSWHFCRLNFSNRSHGTLQKESKLF